MDKPKNSCVMKHPVLFPDVLREFIDSTRWTFAKTMPEWPHEYIVREKVDRVLFDAFVRHIRQHGFEGCFYQHILTYFAEDGFLY